MATPVGQRPAKVPSVLRCAYSRVVSLEAAIRDLCVSSSLEPPELRRADDPPEYADTLLRRTFVAFPFSRPTASSRRHLPAARRPRRRHLPRALAALPLAEPAEQRAVQRRAPTRPEHQPPILRRGCQLRDHATDPAAPRPPDVDVVHKSAAIDALRRPAWRTFASRVGDAVFLHLLTRASVFTPLGERGSSGDAPSPPVRIYSCAARRSRPRREVARAPPRAPEPQPPKMRARVT